MSSELPQVTCTIVFCKTHVNKQYGIAHVLEVFLNLTEEIVSGLHHLFQSNQNFIQIELNQIS